MRSSAEQSPTRLLAVGTWCVYLLRCADGSLYCGITNDLEARVAVHNAGKGARYTRGRGPCFVAYCEEAADRASASRREHALKSLRRAEKETLVSRWRA